MTGIPGKEEAFTLVAHIVAMIVPVGPLVYNYVRDMIIFNDL